VPAPEQTEAKGMSSKTFAKGSLTLLSGILASWAATAASSGDKAAQSGSVDSATMNNLEVIKDARIFFVHQSVGANLVHGLKRLSAEAKVPIRFSAPEEAKSMQGGVFIEQEGGKNKVPKSKVDHLASMIRGMSELKPDIAFVKFCFVDFDPSTDVDSLFGYYQQTINALKKEHPEIVFAHVTAPLMSKPSGFKYFLRRLLGKETWEDAANLKRQAYNQKLLATFKDEPIFDLARFESTDPEGRRVSYTVGETTVYVLEQRYTTDGGHLNELGENTGAKAMVQFLADTVKVRREPHAKADAPPAGGVPAEAAADAAPRPVR
jgi:hypothetical protein